MYDDIEIKKEPTKVKKEKVEKKEPTKVVDTKMDDINILQDIFIESIKIVLSNSEIHTYTVSDIMFYIKSMKQIDFESMFLELMEYTKSNKRVTMTRLVQTFNSLVKNELDFSLEKEIVRKYLKD